MRLQNIEQRHGRACRSRRGGRCDCSPSYRARLWHPTEKRIVNYTSDSLAEARGWLKDAKVALRRGREPNGTCATTVREAFDEWERLAVAGVVRPRSGQPYKPAAIRTYEGQMRLRVFPAFGGERLADLDRSDWQAFADELLSGGLAPATVQGTVAAVAAVYRFAVSRGRLKQNPALGLDLPKPTGQRDRVAAPGEAAALLAALPIADRAPWATAMYAGLRRGELRALRVSDILMDAGVISVECGWDEKEGRIATKSHNRRRVPIPAALRAILAAELLRTGRRGDDLVFGLTERTPFAPQRLRERADEAWAAAELARITLHECRHTYASLMIAAGVNAKALSTYMGHASIQITYDRYGHLMPGNEEQAAGLLDAYLGDAASA